MKHPTKLYTILILFFLLVVPRIYRSESSEDPSENSEDPLKKISIMIPSPDIRSELWDPHFHFLFKHWPDLLTTHRYIPIYLVSNLKRYKNPRVQNIMLGKEKSWSDDLKAGLETVKTEFVVILLDDYILSQDVNTKRLGQIVNFMKRTKGVYSMLSLDPKVDDGPPAYGIDDVIIRSKTTDYYRRALFNSTISHRIKKIFNINSSDVLYGHYRTSLQACVWRVEVLKKLLIPMESAWQFEVAGSIRSEQIVEPFYLVTKTPVFNYLNAAHGGKYNKGVINSINQLGFKFAPTALPIE